MVTGIQAAKQMLFHVEGRNSWRFTHGQFPLCVSRMGRGMTFLTLLWKYQCVFPSLSTFGGKDTRLQDKLMESESGSRAQSSFKHSTLGVCSGGLEPTEYVLPSLLFM